MLTEAQNAEIMLNWSLKNIDEVLECENKYGKDPKVNAVYGLCHLIKGNIIKSYNLFKEVVFNKETSQDDKNLASTWMGRIMASKYFDLHLPEPNDFTCEQSVEASNGWYKEMEYQNKILLLRDNAKFKEYIAELMSRIEKCSGEELAQAQFEVAELALNAKHFEQVLSGYYGAIKANPNKGLYWGLCAGVLNKYIKADPIYCLFFIENAISLDENNAKWYLNKCLIMIRLLQDKFISKEMKQVMSLELDKLRKKAISVCKPNQYVLKKELDNLYELNKKVISQYN